LEKGRSLSINGASRIFWPQKLAVVLQDTKTKNPQLHKEEAPKTAVRHWL
jgi:hypothetical protein